MASERKENVELLVENQRGPVIGVANGTAPKSEAPVPPDGGLRAYSVALASFLTNGLVFGIINSYSIIYHELKANLIKQGEQNAEVKGSLVGSLTIGTTFAMSALSGILASKFGLRQCAVAGGTLATIGMLLSSFFVDNVDVLCFTYGIIFGLGASLAYTPSLAILGQYFKRHLGIVNGVVTVGSSVFTVIMPILMEFMIQTRGLQGMFRVLCVFTIGISLCGLLYKPVPLLVAKPVKSENSFKSKIESMLCLQMWKMPRYRFWALSMPVALLGYFVPYVHIKDFVTDTFTDRKSNLNLPLQCLAVTSALGRILFGFLADRKVIDLIFMQQISFYVIGALTIILPFAKVFEFVIVIALGIGLFEGGFIALIGPVAFELVGTQYAAQGIGCVLGIASVPLSIGPSVAGALYKKIHSYTLPFVLAGCSPIAGATIMFLIRFTKKNNQAGAVISNGHAVTMEKSPAPLLAVDDQAKQLNIDSPQYPYDSKA